jgi:hypothetical protein
MHANHVTNTKNMEQVVALLDRIIGKLEILHLIVFNHFGKNAIRAQRNEITTARVSAPRHRTMLSRPSLG